MYVLRHRAVLADGRNTDGLSMIVSSPREGKKSVFQKEGTEISKGHKRWEPYNS